MATTANASLTMTGEQKIGSLMFLRVTKRQTRGRPHILQRTAKPTAEGSTHGLNMNALASLTTRTLKLPPDELRGKPDPQIQCPKTEPSTLTRTGTSSECPLGSEKIRDEGLETLPEETGPCPATKVRPALDELEWGTGPRPGPHP